MYFVFLRFQLWPCFGRIELSHFKLILLQYHLLNSLEENVGVKNMHLLSTE